PVTSAFGQASPGLVLDALRAFFPYFYLDQLRVVLLVAGAIAFARRSARPSADAVTCLVLAIAPFVFYVAIVGFLPRYALVAMPPFVVAMLFAVRRALPNATAFGALAALVFVLFATRWHPHRAPTSRYELQPPADLSYIDHIEVMRQAAAFVEARYP